MRVLIIGCGYVGVPLGKRLAELGHEVFGLRRSPASRDALAVAGITSLTGDITRPADLALLPGPFDWVINTVSSSHGGLEEYQAVYLHGTRNLVRWLAATPPHKYLYTSSTSVYGQEDGSEVDESSPTEPSSPTSKVLVEAEAELLHAARNNGFPSVILRVAGIYGPERGHLFQQYLQGSAELADGGARISNMIHRDDVGGAILTLLERGVPGEIYNVVDDEPVTYLDFYRWLAQQLGRPLPPSRMMSGESHRKRALTNKRISNRKLKGHLGWTLKYPTYREGYGAEINRLRKEGKLAC